VLEHTCERERGWTWSIGMLSFLDLILAKIFNQFVDQALQHKFFLMMAALISPEVFLELTLQKKVKCITLMNMHGYSIYWGL
jgi:branched-subunit amino acid transport protein